MKVAMVLAVLIIGMLTITACTQAPSTTTATYQHFIPTFTGSQSDFTRYETILEDKMESISDTDLAWVVNYCLQQALSNNSNNYLLSWKDQVLIYQNEQIRRAEIAIGLKAK